MSQNLTTRTLESLDGLERVRKDFADCLEAGLTREEKHIPSRFLYDARGSQLFEDITKLPEYYPTRTERWILEKYADEMAVLTPSGGALVEFGSGSSLKTEILLRHLDKLVAYVAIDISGDALVGALGRLAKEFPKLQVTPIVADFLKPVSLPIDVSRCHKLGFFPGSTIGNFMPLQAICLLKNMSRTLGASSRLLIGVDLKKDRNTLLRAYNDSAGITAEFNLNLLQRANMELGADFEIGSFNHLARYDEVNGRIDMYLVSQRSQQVCINGRSFHFACGEKIHTEHSHKYSVEEFTDLALQAGWKSRTVWMDEDELFSVFELLN